MVAKIELDTREVSDYARFLARAGEVADTELTRALYQALQLIEREVKENTPVGAHGASGLRGSITSRFMGESIDGIGVRAISGKVFSPIPYAIPVELGAKPHWIGEKGIESLQDWVKAKFGIDGKEGRSIAFAIRAKIAKHGTKGAFMFEKAFTAQEQYILNLLGTAVAHIRDRLAEGK